MKISLHTLIIPRLEVFFLEEWISHHLALGIDKIYIYDNGTVPHLINSPQWKMHPNWRHKRVRRLTSEEAAYKWEKKPDADYFEEYSDEEITDKLKSIEDQYKGYVEVTPWVFGEDHKFGYPVSQRYAYKHCIKNHQSNWWITMDPDEYMVFRRAANFPDFISSFTSPRHEGGINLPLKSKNGKGKVGSFWFSQKVFDARVRDKPVREIFNWSYKLKRPWKGLVAKPKIRIAPQDIHRPISRSGYTYKVPTSLALIHHYRGNPETQGGPAHLSTKRPAYWKTPNPNPRLYELMTSLAGAKAIEYRLTKSITQIKNVIRKAGSAQSRDLSEELILLEKKQRKHSPILKGLLSQVNAEKDLCPADFNLPHASYERVKTRKGVPYPRQHIPPPHASNPDGFTKIDDVMKKYLEPENPTTHVGLI